MLKNVIIIVIVGVVWVRLELVEAVILNHSTRYVA